jgi:hypothetical protein
MLQRPLHCVIVIRTLQGCSSSCCCCCANNASAALPLALSTSASTEAHLYYSAQLIEQYANLHRYFSVAKAGCNFVKHLCIQYGRYTHIHTYLTVCCSKLRVSLHSSESNSKLCHGVHALWKCSYHWLNMCWQL